MSNGFNSRMETSELVKNSDIFLWNAILSLLEEGGGMGAIANLNRYQTLNQILRGEGNFDDTVMKIPLFSASPEFIAE